MLAGILLEIERRGVKVDQTKPLRGPQTDDELWQAVFELTGFRIPRMAVCEGHVAPFQIFADVYFGRRMDVLMIGNRGGGKTTISGFLHGAKCRWLSGYTSTIVGATEKQSGRGYAAFKRFIRNIRHEIVSSLMSKTTWKHGSEVEVLTGTVKQVNGPHPHLAQFDEAELTTREIFGEFQNMVQGDDRYAGQQLLSSTRKYHFGIVQGIVKESEDAVLNGESPPWDVMIFCVFETMQKVPGCGKTCGCDKVVKGTWDDGTPRTFKDVCNGRAARAEGHIKLADVQRRFKQLSRAVWESQQECLRPDLEGLVHKWMQHERHVISVWAPKPEYGPVYRSWDWGGTNPHSVHWAQVLRVPVKLGDRLFQEGWVITFDELYYTGGGFYALGQRVLARTEEWKSYGYDFEVIDFCDPSGASAKADVKKAAADGDYPVPKFESRPAPIDVSVQKHIEWGEDGRLYVVGPHCPMLLEEYGTYHWPPEKDDQNAREVPVDSDNHAMDDQRYLVWNLYRRALRAGDTDAPTSDFRERDDPDKRPPLIPGGPRGRQNVADGVLAVSSGSGYLQDEPMGGPPAQVRRARPPDTVR